jgi:predicted RNA-binding Zn-ribbon protein involved in translation (DUF1610 family)
MGNRITCGHKRAKLYHATAWITMGLFDTRVTTYDCEDCGETFTREEARRRMQLTNCVYASRAFSSKDCAHSTFDVDDNTKTTKRDSCFSGTFLRAFMSPNTKTVNDERYPSFWVAHVRCKTCGFVFLARCDFSTDKNGLEIQNGTWTAFQRENLAGESCYVAVVDA